MSYLLDTNVLSEVKKERKASPSVLDWFKATPSEELFISVMVIGEIRRVAELMRRANSLASSGLERWVGQMIETYVDRTLPITLEVADQWGRLCLTQQLPPVDGLMAATALVHDLTLVTRNTRDFERSGARLLNPFVG